MRYELLRRCGSAVLMALVLVVAAQADELTGEQQQKLAKAANALKNVVINFELAQSSAGSGTSRPTGSRAKLSKLRLDSSTKGVPEVKKWLKGLPVAHADVKALQAKLDETEIAIASLDDRLAGKAIPVKPAVQTPAIPSKPAAAPQPVASPTPPVVSPAPSMSPEHKPLALTTIKLGYPHADKLKSTAFHLREVEGNVAALKKMHIELAAVKDPLSINHRQVFKAMGTLQNAQRKSGFANDGLKTLPKNGEGVAKVAARLAIANQEIGETSEFFTPLNKRLSVLIDPANYPDFNADFKRVTELSSMFRDASVFQHAPERAGRQMGETAAAKTEVGRIAKVYRRLMAQETDHGARMEGAGNHFLKTLAQYLAAADAARKSLPAQIQDGFGKVKEMAQTAVENKKPMFFTGGIPQQLGFAKEKLGLYVVLEPKLAPALQAELKQLEMSLATQEKSLSDLIIKQNRLPPNRYQGEDREKIVAVAVDAWKHQQKEFKVLGNRIPSEAWSRETMYQYSNETWYFVDRSKLQVQLLVADEANQALAIIRPVTIIKNHQKGDTLIGTPMYSGDDELQPSAYLMRSKIK